MFPEYLNDKAIQLAIKEAGKTPWEYEGFTMYLRRMKEELEKYESDILLFNRPYFRRSIRRVMSEDEATEYLETKLNRFWWCKEVTLQQIAEAEEQYATWYQTVLQKAEAIHAFWTSKPFDVVRDNEDREIIQLKLF